MKFKTIDDLKKYIKGLGFLHLNDGTDDKQEVIVLNEFFLDIRKIEDYIYFEAINKDLLEFSNLCERKMKNSLDDYELNINQLLLDKDIDLKILQKIVDELEYFKKHVETRFFRTLTVQGLNRYYQIFQATLFFEVNFFIRRTKEQIQKIKEINEVKFEIFKDDTNYYKFETYISVYLQNDNFHPEYSFLYRKLIENRVIEKISHKDFADYLLKLEIINNTQYDLFLDKRNWLTIHKATTLDRESNYNKIFHLD